MTCLINFLFVILNIGAVVLANSHVPVLLWSPQVEISPVLGLREIGSVRFSQYLSNIIESSKPIVAVFVEDSLSSEDFINFGDDDKPVYSQLTQKVQQGNVEYMPSVVNPLKAIRLLKDQGYEWKHYAGKIPKISEPTVLIVNLASENAESRRTLLQDHDNYISDIYGKLQKEHPNLLAIYTGHKPSWEPKAEVTRVRRDAGDEGGDGNEEPPKDEKVIRAGNIVIVTSNITYMTAAEGNPVNFTALTSVEISNSTDYTYLVATFTEGTINFTFAAMPEAWQWEVAEVAVTVGAETVGKLMSKEPVGAPRGWSFFCNQNTYFYPEGKSTKYPRLLMENIQMQANMDMETFEFGQPIDCVPYFSAPIWSGILIIGMLLAIMMWGVLMLMDVNTNDRFDDPKGKTITISATD